MSTHFHFLHPQGGGGAWWSGLRRGGSPEKERERAMDTVNPSPPHLKGEMGPVVLWVCVCVCVWTVCVSTHFHFLHPQGGGRGGVG